MVEGRAVGGAGGLVTPGGVGPPPSVLQHMSAHSQVRHKVRLPHPPKCNFLHHLHHTTTPFLLHSRSIFFICACVIFLPPILNMIPTLLDAPNLCSSGVLSFQSFHTTHDSASLKFACINCILDFNNLAYSYPYFVYLYFNNFVI